MIPLREYNIQWKPMLDESWAEKNGLHKPQNQPNKSNVEI
jgi:hypothetical protein